MATLGPHVKHRELARAPLQQPWRCTNQEVIRRFRKVPQELRRVDRMVQEGLEGEIVIEWHHLSSTGIQ